MKKEDQLSPIAISVENLTDTDQDVSLFSFTENNESVKITALFNNLTYDFIKLMLLRESYIIGYVRLQGDDIRIIENIVRINYKNILGSEAEKPYLLDQRFGLWQVQDEIIDFKEPFFLSAGTSFKIDLHPKQKIGIYFFPILKYFGETTEFTHLILRQARDKFKAPDGNFKLVARIKTNQISEQESGEYTLYPDWDKGITHIRAVGFSADSITVGENVIRIDWEKVSAPVFAVDKVEAGTPMKIRIPEGINGHILFYHKKSLETIS